MSDYQFNPDSEFFEGDAGWAAQWLAAWTPPLGDVLVPVTDGRLSRAEWEAQNDKPWLGLATNRQLLEELTVRLEVDGMLDYRTVDGEQFPVDVAVKGET